jgi:hypothetical protein
VILSGCSWRWHCDSLWLLLALALVLHGWLSFRGNVDAEARAQQDGCGNKPNTTTISEGSKCKFTQI